jgi:hypothetical protein
MAPSTLAETRERHDEAAHREPARGLEIPAEQVGRAGLRTREVRREHVARCDRAARADVERCGERAPVEELGDGTAHALGWPDVYTRAISSGRMSWDRRVRLLSYWADALVLAFLAWRVTTALARIIRAVLSHGVPALSQPAAATAVLAIGMVAAFSDSLAFARLVEVVRVGRGSDR